MKRKTILLSALIILVFQANVLLSQISHGGSPLSNNEDFMASKVIYLLEPEDELFIQGLKSAKHNSLTKALNYATERPVDLTPEMNGQWVERGDLRIWRAHLISPDAFSIGILFSEFALNENVSLFLYDPEKKHIQGSYTAENNKEYGKFYVGHIPGDEVIIELQVPLSQPDYGKIRIGLLSHAFLPVYSEKSTNETGLGTSQDCEIDINCVEGEDWQTIKRAVCHISTTSLLCTGTLINNTAYDGKPYVLTAEHCINKQSYAESSLFYFNYENSECGVDNGEKDKSVSGSTMLATGDSLDFTLLKLSSRPPKEYNTYYAGWDIREQEHESTTALHHPNADAKKISFDFNTTTTPLSVPGDLKDYIVSSNYRILNWDVGTTEGGSSGCPLFNSSKRMIGVLSGGQAVCGDSIGYDAEKDRVIYSLFDNQNDYFSKLYFDWDYYSASSKQLKKWLDPINSGQLSIGGLSNTFVGVGGADISMQELDVYPNPSQGDITLNLPEYSGKTLVLKVYDLTGHLCATRTAVSVFPVQISLPDLNSGIYLLRITDENKRYSGRIMLK